LAIECVLLTNISEIRLGYQTRGRLNENIDGDFAIIRPQDFTDSSRINPDQLMRFFPSKRIDNENYLINPGDILLQGRGQNNRAFLITEKIENTVASNSFYVIRINEKTKILPVFLTWWINQSVVQKYFEKKKVLSTIPFITKSDLAEAPVVIPSLDIQEKIGKLMALWQKEKELSQQLNEFRESLIQTVALQAVEHS